MTKTKKVKGWGGFCEDRLHMTLEYYGDRSRIYTVYISKADAKKCYEDVRPVTISYIVPGKKKK